jgi:hypothetical protein
VARYQDASALIGDRGDVELRRRAADQLVLGGHIPEAIELYREILAELGAPLPEHGPRALARLVWQRWRARRALSRSARRRPATQAESRRLAAFWSAGATLTTIDTIQGAEYQARYVALAARVGDDSQLGRGLSLAAGYGAAAGPTRRHEWNAQLERAAALAAATGDPIDAGWVELGRTICAYTIADFAAARPAADRAEEIFASCAPAGWERRSARMFGIWACYFLGDVPSLVARVRAGMLDADAVGDRFTGAQLRLGVANAVWLLAGDPAGARRESDRAIALWAPPRFQMQSSLQLVDQAQTLLYEGRPHDAHAVVAQAWPALERSQLLRVRWVSDNAWFLRGRVAAAAAAVSAGPARDRLLGEAALATRRIRSGPLAWRHGLARLLEAAVAHVRGERERAVAALDAAADDFDALGMTMHALAARHRHAQLLAGAPPATLAELGAAGVRDPARWLAVLAPGFSHGDQ